MYLFFWNDLFTPSEDFTDNKNLHSDWVKITCSKTNHVRLFCLVLIAFIICATLFNTTESIRLSESPLEIFHGVRHEWAQFKKGNQFFPILGCESACRKPQNDPSINSEDICNR